MSRKWQFLFLSVVVPMAIVLAAESGLALASLLVVPVVLYLPGHVLLARLRPDDCFDLERLLLAFGLSVALIMVAGFLLEMFGWITPIAWGIFFISTAAIAWATGARKSWGGGAAGLLKQIELQVSSRDVVIVSAAVSLIICAFIIDYRAASTHTEFKFTEFWITHRRAPNALTIGIRNDEDQPTTYEVELIQHGQLTGRWLDISLKPGETWTTDWNATFKPNQIQRVEAWLFKNDNQRSVYRRVWADIGFEPNGKL